MITVVNNATGKVIVTIEVNSTFGAVTVVRDASGTVVGALKTASGVRPMSGMASTSFDCYSAVPRFPGQVPLFSALGVNMYPWARQTRKAFSNKTAVHLSTNGGFEAAPSFYMRRLIGMIPSRFTFCTAGELPQGIAVGDKTKGEKPKRHEVRLSSGADGGLDCCL